MRITNSMMTNNSIRNINSNKDILDNLNTMLATGKKIQKASEDPIIAIRALRFRSDLSELNQYLKRNIPDARSWMQLTEDALDSVKKLVSSMITYTVQGSTGTLNAEDKQTIITQLSQYQGQIFSEANSTYSGRSVFTGYKTNSDMTFRTTDTTIQYTITQEFKAEDLDTKYSISNSVNVDGVMAGTNALTDADMPVRNETYRLRLPYASVEEQDLTIKYKTDKDAAQQSINVEALRCEDGKYYDSNNAVVDPYKAMAENQDADPKAYLLPETGEIVMNKVAYQTLSSSYSFETTYEKVGFEKGELRPEHYFTCTCVTNDGQIKTTQYTKEQQDINYTVNFNQKLKVNTEGKNVFSHSVVREIEEMIDITQNVLDLESKLAEAEKLKNSQNYETDKEKIDSIISAAQKELDYAEDIMKTMFGKYNTSFTEYENVIVAELSDIGARCTRLTLNETRLSNQKISLEELKSINEDADEAETIINLTTADNIYQASLAAASKLLSKSLMDYI